MSDEDWEQREVCPDGACIGVIGGDGLCKVCGRAAPNWGSERLRGLTPEADEDEDGDAAQAAGGATGSARDGAASREHDSGDFDSGGSDVGDRAGDDWNHRELCSNGACIGVIGPNGACTVCGAERGATA